MIDVAVIGSGPAGCAAALLLVAKGRSVTLVGRGDTDRGFEASHAGIESLLKRAGAESCLNASGSRSCLGVEAHWGGPTSRSVHTASFLLDRARFDSELRRAAVGRGALPLAGLAKAATRSPQGAFRVSLDVGELEARAVVDATGRGARVARSLGAEVVLGRQLVALVTEIPAKPDAWVRVETSELGWWYRVPGPGPSCSIGVVTLASTARASSLRKFAVWRSALELDAPSLMEGASLVDCRIRSRPAGSSRLDRIAGPGWVCVGDSAMAFEPLASAGVAKAVWSGLAGADAIDAWLEGDAAPLRNYQLDGERRWEHYSRALRVQYATELRWGGEVWSTLRES